MEVANPGAKGPGPIPALPAPAAGDPAVAAVGAVVAVAIASPAKQAKSQAAATVTAATIVKREAGMITELLRSRLGGAARAKIADNLAERLGASLIAGADWFAARIVRRYKPSSGNKFLLPSQVNTSGKPTHAEPIGLAETMFNIKLRNIIDSMILFPIIKLEPGLRSRMNTWLQRFDSWKQGHARPDIFEALNIYCTLSQLVEDLTHLNVTDVYTLALLSNVSTLFRDINTNAPLVDWPKKLRNASAHSQICVLACAVVGYNRVDKPESADYFNFAIELDPFTEFFAGLFDDFHRLSDPNFPISMGDN